MATTVAGLEPDMAAKKAQESTAAMARPPGIQPTSAGGEADDATRRPARRQQGSGEHEEGDRHDDEIVEPGEKLLRDDGDGFERQGGHQGEKSQHGQAQGDGNGHAGEKQRKEDGEDDEGGHSTIP
jgi:hypothetical protein